MPIVADAAVKVGADLKPFNKDLKSGLDKGEKQAQTFGQKLKAAMTPKNLLGAVGLGIGIQQVTSFLGDAVGAASDFGETVSKSAQIFGDEAIPALEEWAEAAASSMGQSKQQALDGAATFAIFGKSAGLAGEDLAGFSTELVELASDLASFHNASPEEVIQAIGAALRGEAEPMRRFGVLLDDASLRAQALKMGIIATTKDALKPQQKVLAAQALIMGQTADAHGDFARTSDGLANQQRILEAELANVTVEVGENLLPVMVELAHFANDTLIPVLRDLAGAISGTGSEEGGFFTDVATNTAKLIDDHHNMRDEVERVMKATGGSYLEARDLIKRANTELGVSADQFAQAYEAGYSMLDVAATAAAQRVAFRNKEIVLSAIEAGDAIPGAFTDVDDAISDPFEEGADEAVEKIDNMYSLMASVIAERENQLRDAGGDAVAAWLDPQVWRTQLDAVNAEIANADDVLAEEMAANAETMQQAREDGDATALAQAERARKDLVREYETRTTELTAEAIKLQMNLATTGTDMEQEAKFSTLRQSAFMLEGLSSKDDEIRLVFEAWDAELVRNIKHMERAADTGGKRIPPLLEGGLVDGRVPVSIAANDLGNAIKSPLEHLNGYPWGYNVGDTIAQGMWDSQNLISDAAYALANAATRQIRVESEPPDHSSPLYGITKWGGNIVRTIADGMLAELGTGSSAAAALAGALVPGFAAPALGLPGGGAAGGGTGPTTIFQLQVSGKEPEVGTRDDILDRWDEMAHFGGSG